MANYPADVYAEEFIASFRRAFIDNGADFIVVDSHPYRNGFLYAAINYGIGEGILYKADKVTDDQQEAWAYRLTKAGRKRLEKADE